MFQLFFVPKTRGAKVGVLVRVKFLNLCKIQLNSIIKERNFRSTHFVGKKEQTFGELHPLLSWQLCTVIRTEELWSSIAINNLFNSQVYLIQVDVNCNCIPQKDSGLAEWPMKNIVQLDIYRVFQTNWIYVVQSCLK